jgi:protein phosphatase
VQEQVDAGRLTPEEARVHPYANVITRCVGSSSDVVPDLFFGTLEPGDLLLLASDGLTGMLDDSDVQEIMATSVPLEEMVDDLIAGANHRGGLDNVTTILVRIEEVTPPTGEVPAMRG